MWPFKKRRNENIDYPPVSLKLITCRSVKGSMGTRKERAKVIKLAKALTFPYKYNGIKEIEIEIREEISPNTSIRMAHKNWQEWAVPESETPCLLPRLDTNELCPTGSLLVEICFIIRRSGGMARYYHFDGYFLSLIMSGDLETVFDARGEEAGYIK